MIKTNCILVDGLPGSGKSATAHLLSRHLTACGTRAEWFFEHDTTHPIFEHERIVTCLMTGTFDAALFESAIDRWTHLSDHRRGRDGVLILESSFYQTPLHLLLLNGWDDEQIARYISQCSAAIQALHPHLVYLGAQDAPVAHDRACACRGEWFAPFLQQTVSQSPWCRARPLAGLDAVHAYLADYIRIVRSTLTLLPFPTLEIDTSTSDYDEVNQQISQFLGLPPMDAGIPDTVSPERFVGHYLSPSGEEFVVTAQDGQLRAQGPSSAAMIPLSDDAFEILGLNLRITFGEPCDSGAYQVARFEANLLGMELEWRRTTE